MKRWLRNRRARRDKRIADAVIAELRRHQMSKAPVR